MSEPLSITGARAYAMNNFKRMSQSPEVTSQLVGSVACSLMHAMEGERLQMHQRASELEHRIIELELAASSTAAEQ